MHLRLLLIAILTCAAITAGLGSSAAALSGKQPIVVVLCKFTDSTNEPQPVQYFQDLFSETGAGKQGVFDYWKDVSYGNLDLTGTLVKGWYTVPMTLAQWQALAGKQRDKIIDNCASMAINDLKNINKTFNDFAGVVVVTNQTGLSEDLFGGVGITIGGQAYNIGFMDTEWDQPLTGILHESGHLVRLIHSRLLSTPNADYGDCYDIMSQYSCGYQTSAYSYQGIGGPGLTAALVDGQTQGWLPGGRGLTFNNGSCAQQVLELAALDHAQASGYLAARIPAARQFGATTSDYYYVELRHQDRWDSGIPQDAVLVHLRGQDGRSYWVDQAPQGALFSGSSPALLVGSEYVDAAYSTYVAVNKIDPSGPSALVTLGACKITASLTYSGPTTGDFNDAVVFGADLLTSSNPRVPVPLAPITFTLGTQSCFVFTDSSGHAACQITITQHPGSYTVTAAFGGDAAYNSATGSAAFTITKEESQVTYGGALSEDYHDAFTASATLVDPDGSALIAGKTVTFTLGVGNTCSAVTDGSGNASCGITPTQVPASYALVASFAGDIDYLSSSDTRTFVITKEETTTTYTGPTVILQGSSGVTLKAQLLEDGTTAPVPFGQTITLSLGVQSCNATTDASGIASCTLIFNGPVGPQPLKADFAGDAYFLPSADSGKTAIVFAFPSYGAFVLGDDTVAAATPSTVVTWWDSSWSKLVDLSSGDSPSGFKGFADAVVSLPTTSPANSCGSTWTSTAGNSPPPTTDVPTYMGVLVASSVTKSGTTISGSFAEIVVVITDPGYAPGPGHPGTGRIVATFCP